MCSRVVAGGRPTRGAPIFDSGALTSATPALWTLVALCANIRRMTTTAIESTDIEATVETTDDEVLAEVLVEEISIDGMCGVY